MIKNPFCGAIVNILFGFLTNLLLMLSIGILYESLPLNDKEQLTNSSFLDCQAFIPIIVLWSFLIILCLISLFLLTKELLNKGCLAWNRDSLGVIMQKMTLFICLLVTTCYFYHYWVSIEEHYTPPGKHRSPYLNVAHDEITILYCFSPMIAFLSLLFLKVSYS